MDDVVRLLERFGDRWSIDAATVEPIPGATNGVVRLEVDGARRVLKVYGDARAAGTEARVLGLLESHDYPAPRVIEADPEGTQAGAPFVLMEDRGRESAATRLADEAEGIRLSQRMGELLARAHAVRLPASGAIRRDRIEPLDSRAIAKGIQAAAVGLGRQNLIDSQTRDAVLAIDRVPIEGDSLCHMDFHPVQCVVDGDRLTAVVDWEGAWAANPEIDLAVAHAYLRFYGLAGATEAFLAGYHATRDRRAFSARDYAAVEALHLTTLAARWLSLGEHTAAARASALLCESVLALK